ncbi:MAG: hypothetical protein E4G90_00435 [Gemmatimonadales bacterium]|nr:MAG: hypothetical protein E4G90_00435 [Gemmatimonadales bacterium]
MLELDIPDQSLRAGGRQSIAPYDPSMFASLGQAQSPKLSWWFWAAIGGTALMLIGSAMTYGDDRAYMEG